VASVWLDRRGLQRHQRRDGVSENPFDCRQRQHAACDRDRLEPERLDGGNVGADGRRCTGRQSAAQSAATELRSAVRQLSAGSERNGATEPEPDHLDRLMERNDSDDVQLSVATMRRERCIMRTDLRRDGRELRASGGRRRIDGALVRHGKQLGRVWDSCVRSDIRRHSE
jgi:hypothetical protein